MVVREGGRGGEGNITEVCLQETGGLGVDCIIDNGGEGGREGGGRGGEGGSLASQPLFFFFFGKG